MNTSATGGYLTPLATPAPLDDQGLFRFVQQWSVGLLTGGGTPLIPGELFFPRWQLDPPNYPGPMTDWASVGIETTPAQLFPVVRHFPAVGDQPEYDQYEIHEWIDILWSFYGPNCNRNARIMRDGMYIGQNRSILMDNDMALTETGNIVTAPSLVKERWLYRADFRAKLRRRVVRRYAILDLESANVTVNNEYYMFSVEVIRPTGDQAQSENSDIVSALATVT